MQASAAMSRAAVRDPRTPGRAGRGAVPAWSGLFACCHRFDSHLRVFAGQGTDIVGITRRDYASAKPEYRSDDHGVHCVARVQAIAVLQAARLAGHRLPHGDRPYAASEDPVNRCVRRSTAVGLREYCGGNTNRNAKPCR